MRILKIKLAQKSFKANVVLFFCLSTLLITFSTTQSYPSIREYSTFPLQTEDSLSQIDQTKSDTLLHDQLEKSKLLSQHFYAGAKVGLLFVFGLEFNYIIKSRNYSILYLTASGQTSFILNTVNAGGGVFLGKTGLGLGCRYNKLFWFESENEGKVESGWAPELTWYKEVGPQSKFIINLHAGAVITKDAIFPDITFGIFLPLTK